MAKRCAVAVAEVVRKERQAACRCERKMQASADGSAAMSRPDINIAMAGTEPARDSATLAITAMMVHKAGHPARCAHAGTRRICC